MSPRLMEEYKEQEAQDYEALVRDHLPMVRKLASRLVVSLPPEVDREDIEEVGLLGLLSAVRTYDPTRGAAFSTYAYMAIRSAMLDELRRIDVLPRARRNSVRAYEDARSTLGVSLGREPTFLEIQEKLGLTVPELEEVLRLRALSDRVNSGIGEASTGISPAEFMSTVAEDPARVAELNEAKERLTEAIAALPRRDQEVVVLYYQQGMVLKDISQILGVTESRVSQILHHALVMMNQYLRVPGEEDT